MLTLDQVLKEIEGGRESQSLDGRDYVRLSNFVPIDRMHVLGVRLKDEAVATFVPEDWTEENVLAWLRKDVAFGFEKALDKRGLSAGMMYSVVKMWLWILEDPLQHDECYAQYGLPLFKAVAVKYGLDNPIGEDSGTEDRYTMEG